MVENIFNNLRGKDEAATFDRTIDVGLFKLCLVFGSLTRGMDEGFVVLSYPRGIGKV